MEAAHDGWLGDSTPQPPDMCPYQLYLQGWRSEYGITVPLNQLQADIYYTRAAMKGCVISREQLARRNARVRNYEKNPNPTLIDELRFIVSSIEERRCTPAELREFAQIIRRETVLLRT